MSETEERRDAEHTAAEEFSPEYLAMLVVCGGSVRDSDWAVLPASLATRRPGTDLTPVSAAGATRR